MSKEFKTNIIKQSFKLTLNTGLIIAVLGEFLASAKVTWAEVASKIATFLSLIVLTEYP